MKALQINHTIPFHFFPDGSFRIQLPGFDLKDCRAEVILDGHPEELYWQACDAARPPAGGARFCAVTRRGKWALDFAPAGHDGLSVRLSGQLVQPGKNIRLTLLRIPRLAAGHVLTQWLSKGKCQSIQLPSEHPRLFTSYYQTMIACGERFLQIAFPMESGFLGALTARAHEDLQDIAVSYDIAHYGGTELDTAPVTLRAGGDGFRLMTDWADANLETPKETAHAALYGWSSWDNYRWTVTEEDVLQNADFIRRDPVLSQHVKRIIIDDGWQYCYGEWDANPRFHSGMPKLAAELTAMGFEPGLWFAPAIVEPHAEIAQKRQHWLGKGESGYPCMAYTCMGRNGFVLDPTVAEVREWLYQLFRRYSAMGFRYFKLDFLHSVLLARQFADPMQRPGDIINHLLRPIHAAVHADGGVILGCNYPFLAGNRYVDAVRIGSDIHSTWQGINSNIIAVASRFWCGRHWLNDPDFALCRGLDTSDDPELLLFKPKTVYIQPEDTQETAPDLPDHGSKGIVDLSRPQLEILLGIVLITGGAVNFSDNMTRLNASGLDLARRVAAAPRGEAGIPLDLFENERPALWLQKVGDHHRLLILNWEESEQERRIDFAALGVNFTSATNFWNDEQVAAAQQWSARLPARSSLLLILS